MKIMLTIGSLQGGGAERVMHWLAENLAVRGHQVTLVTQMPKEKDVYRCSDRVRHLSLDGMPSFFGSRPLSYVINAVRWRRFLHKAANEAKPDVVLSFQDKINVNVLLAFLFRPEPVIACERINPAYGPNISWRRHIRPWLYRNRACEVVFQTAGVEERFSEKWRLNKTSRIPNAVTKMFSEAMVKPGGHQVVAVGRLHTQKGFDLLIKAWAKLGTQRSDWKLRIIGEGPERSDFEALIKRLGIEKSVELPGFCPDVITELQKSSIAVMPSRWEGFPNALVEMLALGRAVIASDLPESCTEIVKHGENGLLFDGTSSDALAVALKSLIDDEGLRERLGAKALEVRECYSEDHCLQLWTDCIERAARCA